MNNQDHQARDTVPYDFKGRLLRATPTLIGVVLLGATLAAAKDGVTAASWIAGAIGCALVLVGVAHSVSL